MNQPWNLTQSRLRKWQRESSSAWELRRILAESEHFRVIAAGAAKRSKNRPDQVSWVDWWAFYLDKLPEREAIHLLLDAWNKDVWAHVQQQTRLRAHQILSQIAEQSQLADEFSAALEVAISESLLSSSTPSGPASDAPPSASSDPS